MADDNDGEIQFDPRVMAGDAIRKEFNYPLTVKTDMIEEMAVDCQEQAVTCIEKANNNYEVASKMLQEEMVKKYGDGWHVVMGDGYGSEVTHDHGSLCYAFVAGCAGVLVWKCN
eukprot:m.39120 g.39120  ORF g.39120 m.39120 type:complete len:114 (-) comp18093_c0_seq1:97-438(-)